MTPGEINQAAQALEGESAQTIVEWAATQFPGRLTFASSLGIEDCVILDMISHQDRPVRVFTLDTELLFPETYTLWQQLESKYGITIEPVRPAQTVAEQAATEGAELWLREADRCCDLRKMRPLRATLAKYEAWITGIRRDQTPDRANAPVVSWDGRFGLIKVNPLVRWTSVDVRCYVEDHQVPYNPLHDQDYPSIGCIPCTSSVRAGEDSRSGRWRGSEKTECGLHMVKVRS